MFLINNDQGFLPIFIANPIFFINPGPVYTITQTYLAKSDREIFFNYLQGLVSIEIFTSNLGNLCSLFYTDHFLTIVEILFTKQVFFFLLTKHFACLAVVNWMAYYGISKAFKGRKQKQTTNVVNGLIVSAHVLKKFGAEVSVNFERHFLITSSITLSTLFA